ncbi:transcription factor [Ganoderma sinense ZZ0214-1]|uniref:Transcription factor n=1 Tax=Ganoderma sinense ZZ0214-1 TaxID=1077348 RepID=A0A2G8SSP3_9APHY|nr:transcription factor [Ganoderma sinense ZZ0214-1]
MPDERDRSVSHDIESDEEPSPDANGNSSQPPVGKPGRKKNPNSQAARRDQNRIAQREFRLRKQQRIRDLEASVEILSGGKDEALSQLRKVLKDLMHENQVLRGLLKSLSAFIGDGAGGILTKVGWELAEFNDLINKAETDTAWESYQRHKRDKSESAGPSGGGGSTSQKRSAEDSDPYGLRPKRSRGGETNGDASRSNDNFPLLVPLNPAVSSMGSNGLYPPDYSRGPSGASPMFVPPASSPASHAGQYGSPSSGGMSVPFQSGYGMSMTGDPMSTMSSVSNSSMAPMAPPPRTPSAPQASQTSPQQTQDEEDEIDPKKLDAYKLIYYHLDNWKRNNNYCLPSSLRPTLVQRTIPHESMIDCVLHPELRDRMILLRERFNLVDCLHEYRLAVNIHGDDVLAHNNWEISESWLQRYKFLVDPATLNITNKWRRERGEVELHVGEYSTEPPNPV